MLSISLGFRSRRHLHTQLQDSSVIPDKREKDINENDGKKQEVNIEPLLQSIRSIDSIAAVCMGQFKASDPQQTGLLSMNLFRSRLARAVSHLATSSSSSSSVLLPHEVELLSQNVAKDPRGRCLYRNFRELLFDIRSPDMSLPSNNLTENQNGLVKILPCVILHQA